MKNISLFQIGVYIACAIGVIAAVILFATTSGQNSNDRLTGSIVIWGTVPSFAMESALQNITETYKDVTVNYFEKSETVFQNELVNALASGTGPDIVILSLTEIISNKDRLLVVPFTSLPEQVFRSTFIDQADAYINDQGTLAFPFVIDPLVMYYNRDMFSSSFLVKIPETWDELIAANQQITRSDDAGNFQTQTVALGAFDNITRSKELLVTLMNQAGNSLVRFDREQKKYISTFTESSPQDSSPVANALSFYTSFTNTADRQRYSWNTSLPNDKNQFISGRLAVYFDFASELQTIRLLNPNLNFGVAMMPQRSVSPVKSTYGSMYGIAVVKMSKNTSLAVTLAQKLASKETVTQYLGQQPFSAPTRRDLLAVLPSDPFMSVIYRSAIISRGFLDPDPIQTTAFFRTIINQINAGALLPESALASGNSLLTSILNKIQK